MKPKDLKYPHSWEDRQPVLSDSVLFVPDHYDAYEEYSFPNWSSLEVFGNNQPVHVEYCSGNGTWIFERAKQFPEVNFVAVEKKFERVRKIWAKAKNKELKNLLIVCGEAHTTTKYYFSSDSVDEVYINFPDPWPKDRHAKHRLVQSPFAHELARILKRKGLATLVTDHANYSDQMIEVMMGIPSFSSVYSDPYFSSEKEDYGTSFFEELWRSKGKSIRYHLFQKGTACE